MRHWMRSRTLRAGCCALLAGVMPLAAPAQKDVKSGVRPQVISVPDGPGAIEGFGDSFEPQVNMGSGSYAISVRVPPGRAGFAPSLALVYDGGAGNAELGMGWTMPLLHVRRQCDKGLPQYTDTDTFLAGSGDELVPVGAGSGGGLVYRAKNEGSFTKFEFVPEEDRWVCTDRSGVRYALGARFDGTDVSARIRSADGARTYAWHVAESEDTNGNRIAYEYAVDQGYVYCIRVVYGYVGATPGGAVQEVLLNYEDRPNDPVADYRPGFRVVTARRLAEIVAKSQGTLVRRYSLEYAADRTLSLLVRVTQYGNDGVSALPPAEFAYTVSLPAASGALNPVQGLTQASILLAGQSPDEQDGASEIIDFNGDALPDLYQSRHGDSSPGEYDVVFVNQGEGVFAKQPLSQAESLGLPVQSENSFVEDIDGDALADLVAQKGSNPEDFVFRRNTGGAWADQDTVLSFPAGATAESVFKDADVRPVDLDFDKRTDSLRTMTVSGPGGPGIGFQAYMNQGNGVFTRIAQTMPLPLQGLAQTFSGADGLLLLADMNGDRLQDLVLLRDQPNGGPLYWPSMGYGRFDDSTSGYQIPLTDGPDFGGDHEKTKRLELGDLDGDGLADLYYVSGSSLRYWLNEGGLEFGAQHRLQLPGAYDPAAATYRLLDLDGDGLQDLLFYVTTQATPDYLPRGFAYVRLFEDNANKTADGTDNDADGLTDEADEGNSAPNLLCSIQNGIGGTTSLLFESHVNDMVRDRKAGSSWTTVVPFPAPVLRRIDVHDGRSAPDAFYTTLFAYHDGYYDGREMEFRGFGSAETRALGDASGPELVTELEFDTGVEFEVLKGVMRTMEVRQADAAGGGVFSSEEFTWEPRDLLSGINGDARRVMFAAQTRRVRTVKEGLTSEADWVQLQWDYDYDDYGNTIYQMEYGRLDGDWDDERVTQTTYTAGSGSGLAAWMLNRACEVTISDETGTRAAQQRNYYDGQALGEVGGHGNLTRTEAWVSGDHYAVTARNDYDAYGNIIAARDALYGQQPGHYREFDYDDVFHSFPVAERIHTGNAASPLEMRATYDYGLGVVLTSSDFNVPADWTTYDYDTFGRLVAVTRPPDTSATVRYDYFLFQDDGYGRPISWITAYGNDGSGGTIDSRSFFDGLGRKIMTRSEGETNDTIVVSGVTTFNARKQPWVTYLPYPDTGTLAFKSPTATAHFIELQYDALGRERKTHQADGTYAETQIGPLETFVRDEEQTREASLHAGCGLRHIEDGLGRLRQTYERVNLDGRGENTGTLQEWLTAFDYDLLGNLTRITDAQGNQKTAQYDALGRKTAMDDPDRGVMTYHYDDFGNLEGTLDAKGQRIYYTYDGTNRLLTERYGAPDAQVAVTYHYDSPAGGLDYGEMWTVQASGVAEVILGAEETANAALDLNGDDRIDVADAVMAARADARRKSGQATGAYTRGSLAWVEDATGEEHVSYDQRGRVVWRIKRIRSGPGGAMSNYFTGMAYDSADRLTRLTYPDQTYITCTYNARGLLETVPGVITGIQYNAAGEPLELGLACGATTTRTYDLRMRLSSITTRRGRDNLPLQDLAYAYDAVSNVTSITDLRPAASLVTMAQECGIPEADAAKFRATQTCAYDCLYRLTEDAGADTYGAISYRYDPLGNMVRKTASMPDTDGLMHLGDMTYGRTRKDTGFAGPHAITGTSAGPSGPIAFSYDPNGNMTTLPDAQLAWDIKDRLVSAAGDGRRTEYAYDFSSRRVSADTFEGLEKSPESSTRYIDANSEVRDGVLVKYVHAAGRRIASARGAIGYPAAFTPAAFYLQDHLNSTIAALDRDANCILQQAYYAYGVSRVEARRADAESCGSYTFSDKERDAASGLTYFGSRYQAGFLGSFASVDYFIMSPSAAMCRAPQALNPYAYANRNPVTFVDGDGDFFWAPVLAAVGAGYEFGKQVYLHDKSWHDLSLGKDIDWTSVGLAATSSAFTGGASLAKQIAVDAAYVGAVKATSYLGKRYGGWGQEGAKAFEKTAFALKDAVDFGRSSLALEEGLMKHRFRVFSEGPFGGSWKTFSRSMDRIGVPALDTFSYGKALMQDLDDATNSYVKSRETADAGSSAGEVAGGATGNAAVDTAPKEIWYEINGVTYTNVVTLDTGEIVIGDYVGPVGERVEVSFPNE